MKPNKRELRKIGNWLLTGDVGKSSQSLAGFCLYYGNTEIVGDKLDCRLHTPCDPSDFKRCIEFLDCLDESNRYMLLWEIGKFDKKWQRIKDEWYVLLKLWSEEKNQQSAPKLYAFMKKIRL